MEAWIPLGYLLSAALFIFGLKNWATHAPLPVETNTAPWACLWPF